MWKGREDPKVRRISATSSERRLGEGILRMKTILLLYRGSSHATAEGPFTGREHGRIEVWDHPNDRFVPAARFPKDTSAFPNWIGNIMQGWLAFA